MYTSVAHKDGRWWVVQSDQFPGAISQAQRLDDAESIHREAIAFVAGVPVDAAQVSIRVHVNDVIDSELAEVNALRADAHQKQARAATLRSKVAHELKVKGFTVRDIGVVLGVSHQRAHQLLSQ